MRIREITFNNVRAFRGEHRISFVDPLTDEANPVTVIAGTNGTGKTTILEYIKALLEQMLSNRIYFPAMLLSEIASVHQSFVRLTLALDSCDLGDEFTSSEIIHIVLSSQIPAIEEIPPNSCYFCTDSPGAPTVTGHFTKFQQLLIGRTGDMLSGRLPLAGGLIYFPQNRQLFPSSMSAGGIEPPTLNVEWISKVVSPQQWNGSLESLWVWQNYLDLEAKDVGRETNHLKPFIQTVEEVLGNDRRITVREGRVMVPAARNQNGSELSKVRLDQLPSGEQQCLFLLGELARRRRLGAIIAVDEPETSLHPTLQRLLLYQLRKLAREWDCQLILATHSLEVLRSVHESQRVNLDHLDVQSVTEEPPVEVAG